MITPPFAAASRKIDYKTTRGFPSPLSACPFLPAPSGRSPEDARGKIGALGFMASGSTMWGEVRPSASHLVPHNFHMGFPIGSQSPY